MSGLIYSEKKRHLKSGALVCQDESCTHPSNDEITTRDAQVSTTTALDDLLAMTRKMTPRTLHMHGKFDVNLQ